jgi:hypothetical protein
MGYLHMLNQYLQMRYRLNLACCIKEYAIMIKFLSRVSYIADYLIDTPNLRLYLNFVTSVLFVKCTTAIVSEITSN